MANTPVKFKIRNGSAWDLVYPETSLDQINDLTTSGKSIVNRANPSETSFVSVSSAGVASWRTAAQMRSDLVVADADHDHAIADVTGLSTALAGKADLTGVGGVLVSSQVPSWIIGGMYCAGSFSDATKTIDSTFRTTYGMDSNAYTAGRYVISTNAGCVVTLAANHVVLVGDEGDTVSTITLESGDWIVYRGYSSPNYQFDIVNNAYQHADVGTWGIVALSNGSKTKRGQLASSTNPLYTMDEYALRQVMRGIYYEDTEGGVTTPLSGDLLLEY